MSWKLVALFVLLCPLLGARLDAQEIQSNPLMKEYNQAWRLTGQQKYDDALVILKEIIAKDKTFHRAYTGIAEAYKGKKDLAEAERYFRSLLEQDGQNGLCYYGLGKVYEARKDYHPAREQYKKCIELAPDWYGCYWVLVQSFVDEGGRGGGVNWGEAVDYFKKRVGEHPDNPALYLCLGTSYRAQGHLLEALRVYEIGLEKATKNQDVELQYRLLTELGWRNQGHDNTKSLERFEQALRLVEAMGDEAEKISTLMWMGAAHLSVGNQLQAVEHYQQALRLAREAGHKWWEASVLRGLGVLYVGPGNDRKKALECYEQALRVFQEIGDLHGQVDLLGVIAGAHQDAGDDQRALEHFQRALKLAREAEEIMAEGGIQGSLASFYGLRGNLEKALEHYEGALKVYQQIRDPMGQAILVSGFGLIYQRAGNYHQALNNFLQALQLHTNVTGSKLHQAFTLRRIGGVYLELGDYARSLDYQNRSVKRFQEEGYRYYAGATIGNIGLIYQLLGDYARALECYEESLKSAREFHDRSEEERNLSNIGDLYIHKGEYAKAQQHLERSLQLAEKTGNRLFKGGCLVRIGEVYKRTGQYQKALQYMKEGMKVLEGQGYKYRQGQGWNGLGDLYLSLQRPDEAIKCFETALAVGGETGVLEIVWEAQSGLGRALEQKGGYQEALDHYGLAIKAIEDLRSRIQRPEEKSSFLEGKLKVYERAVDLAARLSEKGRADGYDRRAYEYAERGKARAFLDLLEESKANVEQGIDRELLDRKRRLTARLSELQKRRRDALIAANDPAEAAKAKSRANGAGAAKVGELEKERDALWKEYEQLRREIRQRNPKYADLHYPQPITLAQAQRLVDEDSVLLEYAVGEKSSYLFAITDKEYQLHTLPEADRLRRQVKGLRNLIMKTDPVEQALENYAGKYANQAYHLYRTLIKPAERLLAGKKHLIIVPDGALVYLPFEALIMKPTKAAGAEFAQWSYLINKYSIQYAHSATVLSTLKTHQDKATVRQKEFLAFADPIYYEGKRKPGDVQELIKRSVVRGKLARLANSGMEARGIAKMFPPAETKLFLRQQASEENVKTGVKLEEYKKILFSAHGLLNEEKPEFSSIVLTLGDSSTEDGFLQVHEIFNLKLAAELVVLSACQTALGKQVRGEGLIGLTRAFMYAGTPSVVASLWEVSDQSTASLMKDFFRNLRRLDKADALRQAKRRMIQAGPYSHPYYWAAFVLIGERE